MVYIYYSSDVEKKVSLSRANKTLMSLKHNFKEHFCISWSNLKSNIQNFYIFVYSAGPYIVILEINISFSVTDLVRNILLAFTIFILF